jgi:hypothetical protein
MFYVLNQFVTYLLTLPRSYGSRAPALVSHSSWLQLVLLVAPAASAPGATAEHPS